jgi:hypothetical protein
MCPAASPTTFPVDVGPCGAVVFFLGFLASQSPGNINFTSIDFLATKKILRQTSKKKQLKMIGSRQDLKLN